MTNSDLPSYGLTRMLDCTFDEAVTQAKEAFRQEGFGTLTEIDLKQTLHDKIGFETASCKILGVCNPQLAAHAVTAEPYIGLLLPCNVTVLQRDGRVAVSAQDPMLMVQVTANPALEPIAQEARARIDQALARLAG